jgi:hypothetical protein
VLNHLLLRQVPQPLWVLILKPDPASSTVKLLLSFFLYIFDSHFRF